MSVIPPHERKHLWERHPEETPAQSLMEKPGGHDGYPRTLHNATGETRTVTNDDEKTQALSDGWHLTPNDATAVPALPQDE